MRRFAFFRGGMAACADICNSSGIIRIYIYISYICWIGFKFAALCIQGIRQNRHMYGHAWHKYGSIHTQHRHCIHKLETTATRVCQTSAPHTTHARGKSDTCKNNVSVRTSRITLNFTNVNYEKQSQLLMTSTPKNKPLQRSTGLSHPAAKGPR